MSNLYCSGQYSHLLHKSYAERYLELDSLFYYNWELRDNKELFEQELNVLEEEAKSEGDIELECEAKLLKLANYCTDPNWDSTQSEPYAFLLLEIAKENELIQIEVRCRQFLGRYYMEKRGRYIEAMNQFQQSYFLLNELSTESFPAKKECLYNVAHAYYTFGDFAGAKKYLLKADKITLPANLGMKDNPYKATTYISLQNTLGLIYRKEKRYDSAIYFFENVKSFAIKIHDPLWVGIASGNTGICYYLQGEYDKAIPLLEVDIENSFKEQQIDNGLNSLIKLAEIYMHKQDNNRAKLLLDSARRQLDYAFEPSEHMQNLGVLMAQYYSSAGNMTLAYKYMDSVMAAKQVMTAKKNAMQLVNQHHRLDMQAHEAELAKAENERSLQIFKRNGIIVFLLSLTSFIIILINRQARVHRQKNKLIATEKARAEQDLQNATKQLLDFTKRISEKNELIASFTTEINKYKGEVLPSSLDEDSEQAILDLQNSTLFTEDEWEEFKLNFEKVHKGFLIRLSNKLPELSAGETRFIALSKLKLSNKEMAPMLGISLSGLRNYKYRLRKKLNLEEDGTFELFIENI